MDVDIDKVKDRLRETFILLYNNDLNAAKQVTIEGLLGITLNNDHIVLVNINENLSSDASETRLSIGRPLTKTATKRQFPHKSVRARPFKRYRTAEPNPLIVKPSTYPDAKHTNECTVIDEESQPVEQPNSSQKEIFESNEEGSETNGAAPILSLSDHLGEADLQSAVKSEPGSDELPGQTNHANLGAPDENKKIETHSTNETPAITPEGQQDRDASVQLASKDEGRTDAATETKPEEVKGEKEKSEIADEKANPENTKPPARLPAKSQSMKNAQSNISNHGESNSNENAMVTNPATSVQSSSQPATSSVHIAAGTGNVDMSSNTTGHSYPGKPGDTNMVNSTNTSNVGWFPIPDAANCNMTAGMLGENMMTDGTAANSTDSMDTDTSQLFAATYQVLEGEEDELLSANRHSFYDKPHGSQSSSGTHMNQVHFQNSVTNSQNQPVPHSMPATCSTGTTQNYISKPGPHPPQSSVPNVSSKASEPPKLAHHPGPATNPLSHRPSQPSYPNMWPNQSRVQAPPHNRLQAVGNMAPYGSPVPPRSFPQNYPVRSEATQAKSFENQFSDFIRARHGNPFPPRGPNMQDPSRPQMQSPSSAQNFQSPNVTMNKFQNMNRYPFHQPLGPASGAIRDLACRVPTPQFPRGPPMMQGNMGHQPLQHQPSSGQPPYNQGPLPPQAQQQQQGYLGPTHGQWNQHHGNIPLNQHQMMSQRHSAQTSPQSQAQNFHPQQQQQLMQTAARNEGSPVPQIASPSLSQQAISNIPPIDPPALQHRSTPEKPSTPKKKKSSPKISRESTQESVKIQEEKALLENPHANVHIGHPKGKKCKFHRTKNSKDKYTVFGCRACNVALCKECHDEYHNELGESHQK